MFPSIEDKFAAASPYLIQISKHIPTMLQLFAIFAMVAGVVIALHATLQIPQLARDGGGRMLPKKILVEYLVAAVFLALPHAIGIGMGTIYGSSGQVRNPLDYTYFIGAQAMNADAQKGVVGALYVLQVIGVYAFIKGWLIIKSLAADSGGHATMGTALTHILAGLMLINITATLELTQSMFGVKILSQGGISSSSGLSIGNGTVGIPP